MHASQDVIPSISAQTNHLMQALAVCRSQIEETRAEHLDRLFARRRAQGLAVLSRLTLSKPHRTQDHHSGAGHGYESMGKAVRSTELSAAQKDLIVRKIRANAHLSPHTSPQRLSSSHPYDDSSPRGQQSTPHYQDDSILSARIDSIGKSATTSHNDVGGKIDSMGEVQSPLRVSMTHEDVEVLKVLNGDSVYEKGDNNKSHAPIDLSRAKPRVLATNYQESLLPAPTVMPPRVLSNDVLVEVGLIVQKQKKSLIVVEPSDVNSGSQGDSNAEETRKRLQRFEKMKIKKQQEAEQRQQQQRLRSQSAGRVRTGSGMPLSPQRQQIQQQERDMIQKKKILNDVPVEVRIGRRDADDVSIFSDNATASTDVVTRVSNRGGGIVNHQRTQRPSPAAALISSEPEGGGMEGKVITEGYLATHLQLKAAARDHSIPPSSIRTSNESDRMGNALIAIAAAPNTKRALSAGPTYRRPTGLSSAHPTDQQQQQPQQQLSHNHHNNNNLPIKSKPKLMSNVSQVKNAVTHVCLAGTTFQQQREEALQAIEHWTQPRTYHINNHPNHHDNDMETERAETTTVLSVTHFVILLYHAKSLSFRSVYAVDPMTNEMKKIYGRGPRVLLETYVEGYFKYETSSKSFKALQTKALTSTADAVSVDPSKLKKILGKD